MFYVLLKLALVLHAGYLLDAFATAAIVVHAASLILGSESSTRRSVVLTKGRDMKNVKEKHGILGR